MAKQLYQGFKNVFTYSAGMQQWVNNNLPAKPEYTFAGDFAIADWMEGKSGVLETYNRVKKEWLNNYKAFTDAAVSINMLSWAHNISNFKPRVVFQKFNIALTNHTSSAKYTYFNLI